MRKRGRPPHPDILTPREWQVLDLLRQDLTNEQIAHRLDISPATAKYHVSEILSKLNLATREQAAAWQPPAVAMRWWQRATAPLAAALRRAAPLTLAKAAGVAFAAAAMVGLAVLAGGFWRTSSDDTDPALQATGTAVSSAAPTTEAAKRTIAPLSERGLLQRGLWKFSVDGATPSSVIAIEGLSGSITEETYQLSPDGGWYAAARRTESGSEILVGPISGAPPTRVPLDFRSYLRALSPRGETLLLEGIHRAETRMYLLDVGTGQLTDVGPQWYTGVQASWSPDGQLLLLVGAPEDQSPRGVYLADAALGDSQLMLENVVAKAEWSPHGDTFAAVAGVQSNEGQLVIAQLDGTVVDSYPHSGAGAAYPGRPNPQIAWSPDGSKLAYLEDSSPEEVSADDYLPTAVQGAHEIHVIDFESGESRAIANGVQPAWSPGGDQLAFIAEGELNVVSAQGGEPRRLSAQTMVPSLYSPHWADASTVLAAYAPRVHESIYVVDVETAQSAHLMDGYSPSYSPDGETIAFVGDSSGPGLGGRDFIYTMNSNGTNLRLLSTYDWSDIGACRTGFAITWSPDGRYVSHSNPTGKGAVVSIDPPAELDIPLPAQGCGVTWSPDSRSIAYFTFVETGDAIAILDLFGDGQPHLLELGTHSAYNAEWSPDGALIAYRSAGEILVVPPSGGASTAVVSFEGSVYTSGDFEWSPDGGRIAYLDESTIRIAKLSDPGQAFSLPRPLGYSDTSFVVEPGSFSPEATVSEPKWSPDGTMIAFTLTRGPAPGEDSSITRDIYITPADGSGQPKRLASGHDLQWSPDGTRIAFTR